MATTHNEYFRPVNRKSVKGLKQRPAELIEEILQRPGNTATREYLEQPYESFLGYESNRKSCSNCGAKLGDGEFIWSWGEYHCGKWRTVRHFCRLCFQEEVRDVLLSHVAKCGCKVELIGKDGELPEWLTI